jgi:dolichol-phosphate mannosyltransferase/undecaprenyl-phosphate 4-deoxy-4-formamido-L-arabinose transferase
MMALLFDSTRRVMSVAVEHAPRFSGRSGYSLSKQLRLALDNICNVSMLPLRAVSALGFVICLLSVVFIVDILYHYLADRITVPGWTTLAVLVAFSSGVVLLALGIMGEYMVRILREVRRAPRYIERERVGFGRDTPRAGG